MNKLDVSEEIVLLNDHFDENYSQNNVEERRKIYQETYQKMENAGADMRLAKALEAFLEKKEIQIREYDIFAGHLQHYNYKDSIPVNVQDSFDARTYPRARFDISKEVENYFALGGGVFNDIPPEDQKMLLETFLNAHEHKMYVRWNSGHVVCSYDRIVSLGLPALIDYVKRALSHQNDKLQQETTLAMLTTLEALRNYILRYAFIADEVLKSVTNPVYQANLEQIAASCRYIAANKPSCLFDALQLFVITLDVMISENISGSISIGRFDQFIYPYYKADIEAGKITPQQATKWIDAVWLKIASLKQSFQNLTIGGCTEEGKFAGNDVTLMCMQSSRKIARDQPLLSFRYHQDMPDEFWQEILMLIGTGLGFPALFNDQVIFKAKAQAGVEQRDLWRYAIVGCVEPSIPGDEYSNTEHLRINWAKVLEVMINPQNKGHIQPENIKKLESIERFDDFLDWYKAELKYFTKMGMQACNMLDFTYGKAWPAPFLSALTEDCPAKGQDITRGALRYSFSSVNGTGMADAVDSLLAIKEIVFEQQRMALKDFASIVNSDFSGYEGLRAELIFRPWRFGNDDDKSNKLMQELTAFFTGVITATQNVFGNNFQAGLYSVDHHASMGAQTGSLPCGRKAGISLANALSPCQGADVNGPTAVICAVTSVDHKTLGNGMVLDLKFTPQFLQKPAHFEKLRQLIISYFDMGGMEIQFNVVKKETLLAAQKEPEKYRNLIVRVSGFSAYFVTLDKVLQNEIIARTEYAE